MCCTFYLPSKVNFRTCFDQNVKMKSLLLRGLQFCKIVLAVGGLKKELSMPKMLPWTGFLESPVVFLVDPIAGLIMELLFAKKLYSGLAI